MFSYSILYNIVIFIYIPHQMHTWITKNADIKFVKIKKWYMFKIKKIKKSFVNTYNKEFLFINDRYQNIDLY